jgi:CheY-like chemotaxis protein
MILETPDIQNDRKPEEPVILSDFRPPEAHQSVILVADDSALVRNLVGLMMQHEGHVVLSAADGQEGLELSRKYIGTIDLLITDTEMPRMSGADLCAHLLGERPAIKVLVMSSADMSERVSQDATLSFLHKPFDGKDVRERVQTILAAPRQLTDVTIVLSELYSELKRIDQEILSLNQSETGTRGAVPRLVTGQPKADS